MLTGYQGKNGSANIVVCVGESSCEIPTLAIAYSYWKTVDNNNSVVTRRTSFQFNSDPETRFRRFGVRDRLKRRHSDCELLPFAFGLDSCTVPDRR